MDGPNPVDVQEEPARFTTTKRYWKEPNGILCSICHDPDHIAKNCNHQLCLTCGAIDEHSTRQCPVSLVCYGCGSRGHLSRHCPSSSRRSGAPCARCRSTIHLTLNCPSIWRCYDEEPNPKPKRVLKACYHCGDTGDHFGDECPFRRSSLLTEPSAFSSYAISHHRDRYSPRHDHRSERDSSPRYKDHDRYPSGPMDRHRQSEDLPEYRKRGTRPSERARAAYAQQAKIDDEDDWFSKRHHKETPKRSNPSPSKKASRPTRIGGSYKGFYMK